MNTIVLKCFISKLDFIAKKIGYSNNNNYEINIQNINESNNIINGNIFIKNENPETITFNIQISESEDILIFKSIYKSDSKQYTDIEETEIDTFAIVNQDSKSFLTPKTKYLIHLVGTEIKQAYIVNKKYKFSNGIGENYTKLNMDNKEIFNNIKNHYELQTTKKSR